MKVSYNGKQFTIEAGVAGKIVADDSPLIRSCIHLLQNDATDISEKAGSQLNWTQDFIHPLDDCVTIQGIPAEGEAIRKSEEKDD